MKRLFEMGFSDATLFLVFSKIYIILNFNVFKLFPFNKILPFLEILLLSKKSFDSTIVKSS